MRRIIPKKSFCIFLSSLTICFRKVVINAWKTIFYITIVLKITIFSSSVGFLIFHILKLVAYLLEFYKDFSLLLIFCYKRNGYLIFLMYQYSDLYNAYHRLPLEPLAGLQYPQFHILLNLVLILKSTKKMKRVDHMLYRSNILQEKGCIISICRMKVVIIKNCHSFNLRFWFYKNK